MTLPRTLLITTTPPGRKSAGGVFVSSICNNFPHDKLVCFHTRKVINNDDIQHYDWLPMKYGKAPTKHGFTRMGDKLRRITRPIAEIYNDLFKLPRLSELATQFGKIHNVKRVLVTLDSASNIKIALPVSKSLGIPLSVIVWDPPRYNQCSKYRLDRYSCMRLMNKFDNVLRHADKCAVPSYNMKEQYEENYNTECYVMVYGDQIYRQEKDTSNSNKKIVRIGFAGNIISRETWNAFIRMLSAASWRIHDREVRVRILGAGKFELDTKLPLNLEVLGWRGHQELIQYLSECDIAYLPYPMNDSSMDATRHNQSNDLIDFITLSFPSKMASYMAAGLPVFFHGKIDSSAAKFIDRFSVGVNCDTLEQEDIHNTLTGLLSDMSELNNMKKACQEVFIREFSNETFKERLHSLVTGRKKGAILNVEQS